MPPTNGLVHRQQLKWQESNVALINSSLDHTLKSQSATTEPAWQTPGLGSTPGLFIFRIESFQVIPVPRSNHGSFHTGDSYIILHSQSVRRRGAPPEEPERLVHDVYFWLGNETSQDEAGTAAYKTVELDEFLGGLATQHRETEGEPSSGFLKIFPRLTILKGGVASGFRKVERSEPEIKNTLLRVYTIRSTVLVAEVEPSVDSLDSGDCFVLDTGLKIWVWQGKECSPMEKAKAGMVATEMKEAKRIDMEVLQETEYASRKVLAALGNEESTAQTRSSPRAIREAQPGTTRLLRLSDASGQLTFSIIKESPVTWSDLDSNDVFIIDTGSATWVWQGSRASRAEKALWLKAAQTYLTKYRPEDVTGPIGKVVEGYESPEFIEVVAN